MEQQSSQNPTTVATDLESQPQPNHPKDSNAESDSWCEITEDLLNQYQRTIPDNTEYDKIRKTCPMILSQIWAFLYVGALLGMAGTLIVLLVPGAWANTLLTRLLLLGLILLVTMLLLLPAYGSLLLWIGIYTKNFSKIEKSESYLMCCSRFFGSCTLAALITVVRRGSTPANWICVGLLFGVALGAGISYVTALCVRNRMERGDPLGEPIKEFFEPLMKCLS